MYGKYTVSIKNCIYGLTYIQFILFQHKFRIFVVVYIPTLEKAQQKGPSRELLLLGVVGSLQGWDPINYGLLGVGSLQGWDPWDPINFGCWGGIPFFKSGIQ